MRWILAGCGIFFTMMISFSTAIPVANAESKNAFVKIKVAPKKFTCLGDSVPVVVWYSWDNKNGGVKINPIRLPDMDPSELPGIFSFTSSRGDLSLEKSLSVDYGPGTVEMTYTAKTTGDETLQFILDYPKPDDGHAVATRSFVVKKCNYHFKIRANISNQQGDYVAFGWTEGEGDINFDGEKFTGGINLRHGYSLRFSNKIMDCSESQAANGWSRVSVSGSKVETNGGYTYISLKLDFGAVSETRDGVLSCVNTQTGDKLVEPLYFPPDANTAAFIKSEVTFMEGRTSDRGKYGDTGLAMFYLTPNPEL